MKEKKVGGDVAVRGRKVAEKGKPVPRFRGLVEAVLPAGETNREKREKTTRPA